MENMNKQIGMRIKQLVKREKTVTYKKQVDQANEMGIAPAVFSRYLSGKMLPKYSALVKIAKYYNVTTDFILGLEEENIEFSEQDKKGIMRVANTKFISSSLLSKIVEVTLSEMEMQELRNVKSKDMKAYTRASLVCDVDIGRNKSSADMALKEITKAVNESHIAKDYARKKAELRIYNCTSIN